MPRPIVIAPDAFKGTMSAHTVAAALGRGLERAGHPPPDLCPVADGGEGTLDVLLLALGGEARTVPVRDPLGRAVNATLGLVEDGDTAIVEVAQASGLGRLAPAERDPERATTHGTGDLIQAAADLDAAVIIVCCGGSATVDGGAGALAAIGDLRGSGLVVLSDVRTPYERAAAVYGPQKGAAPAAVARLEQRLDALAAGFPRDPRGVPMTGAAGGLSGALWAAHGALLQAGAAAVLDAVQFDRRALRAAAVLCGEGRLDETSLEGKAVGEIGTRCRQRGIPCMAVVGSDALDRFGKRIVDLVEVREAGDVAALEAAAEELGNGPLAFART